MNSKAGVHPPPVQIVVAALLTNQVLLLQSPVMAKRLTYTPCGSQLDQLVVPLPIKYQLLLTPHLVERNGLLPQLSVTGQMPEMHVLVVIIYLLKQNLIHCLVV